MAAVDQQLDKIRAFHNERSDLKIKYDMLASQNADQYSRLLVR